MTSYLHSHVEASWSHWLPGRCSGSYKPPLPPTTFHIFTFLSNQQFALFDHTTSSSAEPPPCFLLYLIQLMHDHNIQGMLLYITSASSRRRRLFLPSNFYVLRDWTRPSWSSPQLQNLWQWQNILSLQKMNQIRQQASFILRMSSSTRHSPLDHYLTIPFSGVIAHRTNLKNSQVSYPGLILRLIIFAFQAMQHRLSPKSRIHHKAFIIATCISRWH